MAFASVAELAAYLRRSIEPDDASALLALDLATGTIRNEARQTISVVEDDEVVLRGQWSGDVWLPERPVIEVTEITLRHSSLDDEVLADSDFVWDELGLLRRASGYWGGLGAVLAVTYSHGFTTVPDDIKGLCLQVAGRLFENPSNVAQETIGSYSYSVSTGARTGVALSVEERRVCWRYRRRTYP